MSIITEPLHTFKDGSTFVSATIDNGQLVIAATRNEEAASEGRYGQLIAAISLQDAIAIAKAVLATQQADEDARFDAWVEAQAKRREDYEALVDSSLEHDIAF